MDEYWIPIVMFISLAAVMGLYFLFRFRTRKELQETIRLAIEKDTALTPEFLQQLRDSLPPVRSDLRRGVLSIALAAGLVAFSVLLGEEDATHILIGAAAFPFMIGVAYIGLWKFGD